MRFITEPLLIVVCLCSYIVRANTESFLLHVPDNFPVSSTTEERCQVNCISLGNSNVARDTLAAAIQNTTYVELRGLLAGETYQIKICWTALDPVSISDMGWIVVPHSTEFQNTRSDEARIFIKFTVVNKSWPAMDMSSVEKTPINISVVNTKLGIPVDFYKVIIYIAIVMGLTWWMNRLFEPYTIVQGLK